MAREKPDGEARGAPIKGAVEMVMPGNLSGAVPPARRPIVAASRAPANTAKSSSIPCRLFSAFSPAPIISRVKSVGNGAVLVP